jgi:hypothetical protein
MRSCRRITPILAFAITSAAFAQQTAPAPPARSTPPAAQSTPSSPSESAQQLAAAMQVIQKELNSVGKLDFVVHVSNADEKGTSQLSEQVSKVIADPATCTIRYHWWESISGNVVDDEDMSISLHDVLGVSTMSAEESWKKEAEQEGATPDELKVYYEKFDPPMFIVAMKMTGDDGAASSFTDQTQASRVGQAVAQAVKLCGGKTDPN